MILSRNVGKHLSKIFGKPPTETIPLRMRAMIHDGWSHVWIDFINERVDTMPDRIRADLDGHGTMTGYLRGRSFVNKYLVI